MIGKRKPAWLGGYLFLAMYSMTITIRRNPVRPSAIIGKKEKNVLVFGSQVLLADRERGPSTVSGAVGGNHGVRSRSQWCCEPCREATCGI